MAKKDKLNYFKAYEKLTSLAINEAELLIEVCEKFSDAGKLAPYMEKMHEYEHAGDGINHDIFAYVATDFMPPFDREDIVELAQSLDNVLDYIDDVLGHMQIYSIRTMPENAKEFARIILKISKSLNEAAESLHNFKKNKRFKELIVNINSLEEEGDKLYKKAISELYSKENNDVMRVLIWTRLYEHMEKCCDAAEHAANVISTILMKH